MFIRLWSLRIPFFGTPIHILLLSEDLVAAESVSTLIFARNCSVAYNPHKQTHVPMCRVSLCVLRVDCFHSLSTTFRESSIRHLLSWRFACFIHTLVRNIHRLCVYRIKSCVIENSKTSFQQLFRGISWRTKPFCTLYVDCILRPISSRFLTRYISLSLRFLATVSLKH